LILPQADTFEVLRPPGGASSLPPAEVIAAISCRFVHDRVHQAAYSLIDAGQRRRVHLKVGRRLLETVGATEEHLFDLVNHFALGYELVEASEERLLIARLNLRAGIKAKNATAYDAARSYLRVGLRCLPQGTWQTAYALTFELHLTEMECAYLLGDFDRAEDLSDLLLRLSRDRHDKARIYSLRIAFLSSVGRFKDSIAAGIEGLELYGIHLSDDADDLHGAIERELAVIRRRIGDRTWDELLDLPPMTDQALEDCMQLMMNLTTQTYIAANDRRVQADFYAAIRELEGWQ
jgi:predicted ATPase